MATSDPSTEPGEPAVMTGEEFRAAVARLGFASSGKANDEGLSAVARFFGADPRSARRWLHSGPPRSIAIALRLMLAGRWDATQAAAIIRDRRRR